MVVLCWRALSYESGTTAGSEGSDDSEGPAGSSGGASRWSEGDELFLMRAVALQAPKGLTIPRALQAAPAASRL